MSTDKFTRRDNLVSIREALVQNEAGDLASYIDTVLRQQPVIKGNQHRGDSIHDGYAVSLPREIRQQILDALAVIPDLHGQNVAYGGKQVSFLLNEFNRCVS